MANDLPIQNGSTNGSAESNGNGNGSNGIPNFSVKTGLARMLKGGVIMDVINAEQVRHSLGGNFPAAPRASAPANPTLQARIAEEAGACAVMALERVPADIRANGGVARMSDPLLIKEIMEAVTIPVMAKARIGHFVECQVCSSPDDDDATTERHL